MFKVKSANSDKIRTLHRNHLLPFKHQADMISEDGDSDDESFVTIKDASDDVVDLHLKGDITKDTDESDGEYVYSPKANLDGDAHNSEIQRTEVTEKSSSAKMDNTDHKEVNGIRFIDSNNSYLSFQEMPDKNTEDVIQET